MMQPRGNNERQREHLLTIQIGTDQQLLTTALDSLVLDFRPQWSKWIGRGNPRLSYDEARQEARIAVNEAAPNYDSELPAGPFLTVVIRRALIQATTRTGMRRHDMLSLDGRWDGAKFSDHIPDDSPPVPEQLHTSCRASMTLRWLRELLSAYEYDCLIMQASGSTYEEIAVETGTSFKQVGNGLQRATAKIEHRRRIYRIEQKREARRHEPKPLYLPSTKMIGHG